MISLPYSKMMWIHIVHYGTKKGHMLLCPTKVLTTYLIYETLTYTRHKKLIIMIFQIIYASYVYKRLMVFRQFIF